MSDSILSIIIGGFFVLILLVIPICTCIWEFLMLFFEGVRTSKDETYKAWWKKHKRISILATCYGKSGWIFEIIMFTVCFFYEKIYLEFMHNVFWYADWTTQLYNNNKHQPVNMDYGMGILIVVLFFFIGMIILYLTNAAKTPPLITSLALSFIYIGAIYSIIWTAHIISFNPLDLMLLLLPINTILIALRLIIRKVGEYELDINRSSKIEASGILSKMLRLKNNAMYIPVLSLILVVPMLGVIVMVLILFGQAPDASIKAFTETSDFLLSARQAPQNLIMDEHYLCTVAAGGDKKVVKPIRKGYRHGHEVIVNRQLQIANAFEEELMVHAPKAHRVIRDFYDTYGFPVARAIKKNWIADMVYFIMKPLEYLFVIILYLVEVHPEDRISMQYTGTTLEKFKSSLIF